MFFLRHSFRNPSTKSRLHRDLRRRTLAAVISGAVAVSGWFALSASNEAHAQRPAPIPARGGISILVHQFDPTAHVPLTDFPGDETTLAPIGTHDSIPLIANSVDTQKTNNPLSAPESVRSLPRTSPRYQELISSVIAATAAQVGIPLQPILEPFAMVGSYPRSAVSGAPADALVTSPMEPAVDEPEPDNPFALSLAEIEELDHWWYNELSAASATHDAEVTSDEFDLEAELAKLAQEEPLDATAAMLPKIDDTLCGSGPMIVTLSETYMPYDFAARDLERWGKPARTFQLPAPPNHYVMLPSSRSPWSLSSEPAQPEFVNDLLASPECLLDELLWEVTGWLERFKDVNTQARRLGADLARLSTSANVLRQRIALDLVEQIPAMLPRPEAARGPAKLPAANLVLAQADIPAPVADPLPNAPEEEFLMAMIEQSAPAVPLTASFAPTADPLPDAEMGEAIERLSRVAQSFSDWSSRLQDRWNQWNDLGRPTVAQRPSRDDGHATR